MPSQKPSGRRKTTRVSRRIPSSIAPEARIDINAVPDTPKTLPIRDMSTLHDLPIDHDETPPRRMFTSYEARVDLPRPPPRAVKKKVAKIAPKSGKRPGVHISLYRKLATSFIVLAVLLLGFVLYMSFTRATVEVIRKPLPVSAQLSVTVRTEPAGEDEVAGAVLETVAEGTKTVAADGQKKTVDAKACGAVTIINGQGSAQPLVATTRLLSEGGVLFRLAEQVLVPGGGRVEARACADQPGAVGNIGPARFTIPGLNATLQEKIYAVSTAEMTGGVVETSVVTQADVDAATAAYAKEVADDAAGRLVGLLARPEMGTGSFVTHRIVRRETTAKVGQEQATFDVTVAVSVNAVFYDRNTVEKMARQNMKETLGTGKDVQALDRDSFSVTVKEQDIVEKKAILDVAVNGTGVLSEDHESFDAKKLTGMSLDAVQEYFMAIEGVQGVNVRLSPAWIKRLPNLPDHITIVIK